MASKEQDGSPYAEFIWRSFTSLAYLYVLSSIVRASASRESRKIVRERTNGLCETCGAQISPESMVVAHINHQRDREYNNPENLRGVCICCEAVYHLSHLSTPGAIGMRREGNDATAFSYYKNTTPEIQAKLEARFPQEIDYLKRKFKYVQFDL